MLVHFPFHCLAMPFLNDAVQTHQGVVKQKSNFAFNTSLLIEFGITF